MKKNILNSVHLDGILEGVRFESRQADEAVAWASVVTLHVRPQYPPDALPADKFERLHHDVMLTADDEEGVAHLDAVKAGFDSMRDSGELFACSLNGVLSIDKDNSFVRCASENFRRADMVKTNDNNIANIEGTVTQVSVGRLNAKLRIDLGDGELNVFVSQKDNPEVWGKISRGEFHKGDVLYMNGPLLSQRLTDGEMVVKMCAVSPHLVQNRKLDNKIRKKGSQSVG